MEVVLLERKVKALAKKKILERKFVRIRRVNIGILPYVKITKLIRDVNSATSVYSDILRLTDGLVKRRRKIGGKGSVALLKESKHFGCVCQDTEPPKSKSISRRSTKFLRSDRHCQILESHATLRQNSGKNGSIARSYSKV